MKSDWPELANLFVCSSSAARNYCSSRHPSYVPTHRIRRESVNEFGIDLCSHLGDKL